LLLDLYGNVPIVTRFDVEPGFAPVNNTRKQVFDFVKQELENGIPVLNNKVDLTTYGRFHRYVAFTTLAKLYLNADVFVGEEMWDEAIAACDSVINCGAYSLSEDYFENFAIYNEPSKENIFVIPFTNVLAADWGDEIYPPRMFQHHLWTLHFNGGARFDTEQGCWDGMCAVPSFYNSYDELDIRRAAWLTGIQFSSTGDTLRCNQEKNGQVLDYTPSLTSLENAYENEGARIAKYDYTEASNSQLENDFVLFRYADVLLMKAEALIRKNGGVANQEAVDLVNQIRERAFPDNPEKLYTTSTLTLEALLAERGWEFAGEGIRRNDLIRFGKYNDPADFRPTKTSDIYNLFPIPQDQINANPNLTQNPGY
jgi:hypothetical protein